MLFILRQFFSALHFYPALLKIRMYAYKKEKESYSYFHHSINQSGVNNFSIVTSLSIYPR